MQGEGRPAGQRQGPLQQAAHLADVAFGQMDLGQALQGGGLPGRGTDGVVRVKNDIVVRGDK